MHKNTTKSVYLFINSDSICFSEALCEIKYVDSVPLLWGFFFLSLALYFYLAISWLKWILPYLLQTLEKKVNSNELEGHIWLFKISTELFVLKQKVFEHKTTKQLIKMKKSFRFYKAQKCFVEPNFIVFEFICWFNVFGVMKENRSSILAISIEA